MEASSFSSEDAINPPADGGWPDCPTFKGPCWRSQEPWLCVRSLPCTNQQLYSDLAQIRNDVDAWSDLWFELAANGESLGPRVISGDPDRLGPLPGDELL